MSSFTPHTTFRLRHLTVFWAVPLVGDLMISGLDQIANFWDLAEQEYYLTAIDNET